MGKNKNIRIKKKKSEKIKDHETYVQNVFLFFVCGREGFTTAQKALNR